MPLELQPPRTRRLPPGVIGLSSDGRAIRVETVGHPCAPLRVLIVGGQHGDEPLARQAVADFARRRRRCGATADVQVACLADCNPDGAARGQRRSAEEIDLNRDHQLLMSCELQIVHRFVRAWQPHLIVDVHTYPPRRKHLLEQGLVHCHDVFLDVPTNLSVRMAVGQNDLLAAVEQVSSALKHAGYIAGRYHLIRPTGRVRHSTPDVIDARNGLTLRYGVPTLLVEGRQPPRRSRPGGRATKRTRRALALTLEEVATWARAHRDQLTARPPRPTAGEETVIGCKYQAADRPARLLMQHVESREVIELPGEFRPTVFATHRVKLPHAYAVPRRLTPVAETLARQGYRFFEVGRDLHKVSQFRIGEITSSQRPNRPPQRLSLTRQTNSTPLDDYQIFPIDQEGGHALAVLLEPASKYGLARLATLGLTLATGHDYPILRCESAIAEYTSPSQPIRMVG